MTQPSKNSSNIIGFPTSRRTDEERLRNVQRRLEVLGIKDVHVTFAEDAMYKPEIEIKVAVADFMEVFLIGLHHSKIDTSSTEVKELTVEEANEILGDPVEYFSYEMIQQKIVPEGVSVKDFMDGKHRDPGS